MALPPEIEAAKNEFAAAHGLDPGEATTFEKFATHLVMRSRGVSREVADQALAPGGRVLAGGAGDIQLDAIAVFIDGELIVPGDSLESYEESAAAGTPPEIVFFFIQATGRDFRRQARSQVGTETLAGKLQRFLFGVFRFFDESAIGSSVVNETVKGWVQLRRDIFDFLDRHGLERACDARIFLVWPGRWREESEAADFRKVALGMLNEHRRLAQRFHTFDIEPVDQTRLVNLIKLANDELAGEIDLSAFSRLPEMPGVKHAFIGYLPLARYLPLISAADEEGRLDIRHSAFFENVRAFQGEGNKVNRAMLEMLREPRTRARFALRNNGITLVTRRAEHHDPARRKIMVRDVQVVNGCQTSYVLYLYAREASIGDLEEIVLPVKILVTDDDQVIDEVVLAANSQTPIEATQIVVRRAFVAALAELFHRRGAEPETPQIWLESRTGEWRKLADRKEMRVVTLPDLTDAFASAFLGMPHTVQRGGRSDMIARISRGAIFSEEHQLDYYYIAGLLLWRARESVDQFRRNGASSGKIAWRRFPAKQHLVYAMRLLLEPGHNGAVAADQPDLTHLDEAKAAGFLATLRQQGTCHAAGRMALQIIDETQRRLSLAVVREADGSDQPPARTLAALVRNAEMTHAVRELALAARTR
ncbi:MAG: AIPR family protein [Hyphomicrobiaceae bacterium]